MGWGGSLTGDSGHLCRAADSKVGNLQIQVLVQEERGGLQITVNNGNLAARQTAP